VLFTDLGPSVGHVFESLWRVGSPATQNAWVRRALRRRTHRGVWTQLIRVVRVIPARRARSVLVMTEDQ